MHCPRCGYQQDSDAIRFCTRCGLEIGDVKALLAPELREKKAKRKRDINKAKIQGFSMILFGLVIVMILAILRDFFTIPKSIITASVLIFMVGGMIRMISPYIFGGNNLTENKDGSLEDDLETGKLSGEQFSGKVLPEAEYRPPLNFGTKKFDTSELVAPPSVTEGTTKQLEKEFQPE